MTEEQQSQADRYLRGEVSDFESADFERQMNEDPSLRTDVALMLEIRSRLEHRYRKQQLASWAKETHSISHRQADMQEQRPWSVKKWSAYLSMAACVLIVVTFLLKPSENDYTPPSNGGPITFGINSDSIQGTDSAMIRQDTIRLDAVMK